MEEGKKLTRKLKNVRDFFEGLFQGSKNKNKSIAKNVSSADEACDESFIGEPVVQKEVLIDWPKKNDDGVRDGVTGSKGTDDKESSGFVARDCDTRENIIETLKIYEKPQLTKSSIQNRNNQNISKSVERPKPCVFKTEDGLWLCEVCSWSSSDNTSLSFLNHCSTAEHRKKVRGRFGSEQEPCGSQPPAHNLSECKTETITNSQFVVKGSGEVSGVKMTQKKQTQNSEEPKEMPNICNAEKPRTEMIFKNHQQVIEEIYEMLDMSHSLSENIAQNGKRVNEMMPEVSSFKEKLFEIVKNEEIIGVSKSQKKKGKKKTKSKKKKKVENNLGVSTKHANDTCQVGERDVPPSKADISGTSELRKWISELGVIFIEPISETTLECKVCEKSVPAGSHFDAMVVNVGIHLEGRGHVKKFAQVVEASKAVVSLMKSIQSCPVLKLPNLIE